MPAYYNEIDHAAAEWLRVLIARGLIPAGTVDERTIVDVRADDLAGFDQCHFFAGIGGWPYALSLTEWRGPVWTGSCPCQPLSSAGQRKGHADERHLWPAFYSLIAECQPATVFGEQVESKDGREWLAGVRADLEGVGYAFGAADLCAAGVRAPIKRQRLYWVASTEHATRRSLNFTGEDGRDRANDRWPETYGIARTRGQVRAVASPLNGGHGRYGGNMGGAERTRGSEARSPLWNAATGPGAVGTVASTEGERGRQEREDIGRSAEGSAAPWSDERFGRNRATSGNGYWDAFDVLPCLDGKARRVEPGTFPLAHGVPARLGRLRGYGNAIVPQVAAEFVTAFMECRP